MRYTRSLVIIIWIILYSTLFTRRPLLIVILRCYRAYVHVSILPYFVYLHMVALKVRRAVRNEPNTHRTVWLDPGCQQGGRHRNGLRDKFLDRGINLVHAPSFIGVI